MLSPPDNAQSSHITRPRLLFACPCPRAHKDGWPRKGHVRLYNGQISCHQFRVSIEGFLKCSDGPHAGAQLLRASRITRRQRASRYTPRPHLSVSTCYGRCTSRQHSCGSTCYGTASLRPPPCTHPRSRAYVRAKCSCAATRSARSPSAPSATPSGVLR